ncbi:hypothetical protein GPECTOR_108g180 [Gonium pectorale]|uniref:Uncharacterized protein n=1 Tax=Gonium pectorale TaxID=33097 RepID=A0A150G0L5_GONPE|nr:hypothetical protein GPECTOR_108g180 [Gonium pectorale]|eukprot:KXZ42985.1 hypothetical protein GPECTOR_108g180 [Gonium pectorale]
MTYSKSQQKSKNSLILYLNTFGRSPIAEAFGKVEPAEFPLTHVYFAYWNKTGVKLWGPKLDDVEYKELPSWYTIKVNGKALGTIRDMKDQGFDDTPLTTAYCLKGTIRDVNNVKPSNSTIKFEIVKVCSGSACDTIPDPATVFISPKGHIVWSVWTVHQKMSVDGAPIRDHAWCPVQSAINLD